MLRLFALVLCLWAGLAQAVAVSFSGFGLVDGAGW